MNIYCLIMKEDGKEYLCGYIWRKHFQELHLVTLSSNDVPFTSVCAFGTEEAAKRCQDDAKNGQQATLKRFTS